MTEEERDEFNMMKQELSQLQDKWASLEASHSIPLEIDQAFRDRLGGASLTISTKSATSENRAVDEAGSATYNVLKAPDYFLTLTISNVTYYVPAYD